MRGKAKITEDKWRKKNKYNNYKKQTRGRKQRKESKSKENKINKLKKYKKKRIENQQAKKCKEDSIIKIKYLCTGKNNKKIYIYIYDKSKDMNIINLQQKKVAKQRYAMQSKGHNIKVTKKIIGEKK